MRAITLISLVVLLVAGLTSFMACGPSQEELYQQQLEQAEAARQSARQAERQQVLNWSSQILNVLDANVQLTVWWNTIQGDYNRQLSEGRVVTEQAARQRETQLYGYLDGMMKLGTLINTTQIPNSCWEAHQTLIKFLDTKLSMIIAKINYNNLGNERDRIEANNKQSEAKALLGQFYYQYAEIKLEWDLH